MIVIGQATLIAAGRKNAPLRKWLAEWTATVGLKSWSSLSDVRVDYPSADGVSLSGGTIVTVFNVKGNTYRLLTLVYYDVQTVEVLEIVTHAEYDKEMWKSRY